MLPAIGQAVQHCRREAFSLSLASDQQAVQHCGFEALPLESCQPALEFLGVMGDGGCLFSKNFEFCTPSFPLQSAAEG